jgi:diguanylate cyclase (GGDEF)-like protein
MVSLGAWFDGRQPGDPPPLGAPLKLGPFSVVPSMSRLSRLTVVGLALLIGAVVVAPKAVGSWGGDARLVDARRFGSVFESQWVRPTLRRAQSLGELRRRLAALSSSQGDATRLTVVSGAGTVISGSGTARAKNGVVLPSVLGTAVEYSAAGRLVEMWVPDRWRGRRVWVRLEFSSALFPAGASAERTLLPLLLVLGGALLASLLIFNAAVSRLRRDAHMLRDHAQERAYLSEHDSLTGLPNRVLLQDTAHQLIMRKGGPLALLMIDLDEFKEINDTLGHSAGDRLLGDVSRRLRHLLGAGELVARLGGDEFAVLTPHVAGGEDAVGLARRIVEVVSRPFSLDGLSVEVRPSIGVALRPDHASDFETLLRFADIAMYHAKQRRTGVEVYQLGQGTDRRLVGLGGELRKAISDGQLSLRYQPKAALIDGSITSLEALVRWEHPTRGLIPPDHFIPLAERSGLIRNLTQAVLEQACSQAQQWASSGRFVPVAVNLSTRDVIDTQLVDDLTRLLATYRIPDGGLELEITEGVLMADPGRAQTVLGRLKTLGCTIAIDDFGTGYSSLAYLRQLPLDSLKIDRTFVRTLDEQTPDDVIVRSTIDLAHNLGLAVIAEGVETQSAWNRLGNMGCDYAQGYYISKPLPANQATSILPQSKRAA